MTQPDDATIALNYIYWSNARGIRVVYGAHVDDTDCAPLLEQGLIERIPELGGFSNNLLIRTTVRGERMVLAGRTPTPIAGTW